MLHRSQASASIIAGCVPMTRIKKKQQNVQLKKNNQADSDRKSHRRAAALESILRIDNQFFAGLTTGLLAAVSAAALGSSGLRSGILR